MILLRAGVDRSPERRHSLSTASTGFPSGACCDSTSRRSAGPSSGGGQHRKTLFTRDNLFIFLSLWKRIEDSLTLCRKHLPTSSGQSVYCSNSRRKVLKKKTSLNLSSCMIQFHNYIYLPNMRKIHPVLILLAPPVRK